MKPPAPVSSIFRKFPFPSYLPDQYYSVWQLLLNSPWAGNQIEWTKKRLKVDFIFAQQLAHLLNFHNTLIILIILPQNGSVKMLV
jgi:hypothetical protein